MKLIITSTDLGYGNVKHAHTDASGKVVCNSFPTIAVPNTSDMLSIDASLNEQRNIVEVDVDGHSYIVGQDADTLQGSNNIRVLHNDFITTPLYQACTKGVLAKFGHPQIDLLVAGLPVSLMASKSKSLKEQLIGHHVINNNHEVTVKNALVIAQPLGGLVDYITNAGLYHTLKNSKNLIIDVGYYTIDWIVSKGILPNLSRSGSYAGGSHLLLEHISKKIQIDHDVQINDFEKLDNELRQNRLSLYGKSLSSIPYMQDITPLLKQTIQIILNKVGKAADMDNIILVGGGAWYFKKCLDETFPSHSIKMMSNPIYANVRGYQIIGDRFARKGES